MPVTKTAKRALRVSQGKYDINQKIRSKLDIAIRSAKKSGEVEDINKAISLADRAVKKNVIHKNKAARIKSRLSKLNSKKKSSSKKSSSKSK